MSTIIYKQHLNINGEFVIQQGKEESSFVGKSTKTDEEKNYIAQQDRISRRYDYRSNTCPSCFTQKSLTGVCNC